MHDKKTFIAEARREQIMKAAIEVLEDIGYESTSLARIAKQAEISTGLISYHFSGKEDLMNHTLHYLVEKEWMFVAERTKEKRTFTEQLTAFIKASLDYQVMHRSNNIALIEIVFNARTPDHTPYYLLEDDVGDPKTELLRDILDRGQEANEFGRFRSQAIMNIIQGAISESMLTLQNNMDVKEYRKDLVESILKIVK